MNKALAIVMLLGASRFAAAAVDRETTCLGYAPGETQQYCRDEHGNSVLCAVSGGSPMPSKDPRAIAWRNGYFAGRSEAEGKVGVLGPTYWPQLELFCIEHPDSNFFEAMRYMYEQHYLDMDKAR